MNDADDRVVLVDPDFLPLLEQAAPLVPGLRHVVVLGGRHRRHARCRGALAYETLIARRARRLRPPGAGRTLAQRALLHLRHHRQAEGRRRHAPLDLPARDGGLVRSRDVGRARATACCRRCRCSTPMPGGWCTPASGSARSSCSTAARWSPSRSSTCWPASSVTIAAARADGVDRRRRRGGPAGRASCGALRHIACGGSQPPRALIERYRRDFGIPIIQAWGMTETSPLASMAWPQARMRDWPDDQVTDAARAQAGLPIPGVEISIRDDDGRRGRPSTARPWARCTCAGRG